MTETTVICCRPAEPTPGERPAPQQTRTSPPRAEAHGVPGGGPQPWGRRSPGLPDAGVDPAIDTIVAACGGLPVHQVGRRPGKEIDPLLTGRVVVVGDDADLAAVVLRLHRRKLLGEVEVGYAAPRQTPFTGLWSLPTGAAALSTALHAEIDLVPLVRDDVGGIVVGSAFVGPVRGTIYVDETRLLRGVAPMVQVEPDRDKGLLVTLVRKRFAGIGRRPSSTPGRAVEFAMAAATVVRDGIPHPRQMERWVFYKHTEQLRLVHGLY